MINPYSHNADRTKHLHVNTNSYSTNDSDDDDKHAKAVRWASSPAFYSPPSTVISSRSRQKSSKEAEHSLIRNVLICQTLFLVLILGTVLCLNLSRDTHPVIAKHSLHEYGEHNLENLAHEIVVLSEEVNEYQQKSQSMKKTEMDLMIELNKVSLNDRKLRGGNIDKENEERVKELQEEILKANNWLQKYDNAKEAPN